MESITAAAVQIRAGSDREKNLARATRLVEQAAAAGATFVALPEVFAWRGPQAEEPSQAEVADGPTARRMSDLAERLGITLLAGSILKSRTTGAPGTGSSSDDRCFNTSLLFGPDGAALATYRKIHLFDIDIPGRVSIRESDTRAAGEAPVVADAGFARIGMSVCYDLRFPELYRRLTEGGAEILAVPASFTRPTGEAHWEPLLRARAIENQCFVIAPNQFGTGAAGFRDHGHSMIIDPWGRVLAEASGDGEEVCLARLDAEVLEETRRNLPCLTHRRLRA